MKKSKNFPQNLRKLISVFALALILFLCNGVIFSKNLAISAELKQYSFITTSDILDNLDRYKKYKPVFDEAPSYSHHFRENVVVEIAKNEKLNDFEAAPNSKSGVLSSRANFVIVTGLKSFPQKSIVRFIKNLEKSTDSKVVNEWVFPWSVGFEMSSGQYFIVLLHPANVLIQEYYLFYEQVVLKKSKSDLPFKLTKPSINSPTDLFYRTQENTSHWKYNPIIDKMRNSRWVSGQTSGAAPMMFRQIVPCVSKLNVKRMSGLVAAAVEIMTSKTAVSKSVFSRISQLDHPAERAKWQAFSVKESFEYLSKESRICSAVAIDRGLGVKGEKELGAYCKRVVTDRSKYNKKGTELRQCNREMAHLILGMRNN